MSKDTSSTAMIGGADGPTAVLVLKKNDKLTFKQKIEKLKYKIKRNYVERTIKANSHSMDEVMEYIVNTHGFVELEKEEVHQEYKEMRASFMIQYASDLLGEYATMPRLKSESQEDILAHIRQIQNMQQKAMEIPTEQFDIDFHKFQIVFDDINDNIHIAIEKKFGYIGAGASGNKKVMKRFHNIYKDVYRYYGVSEEDIKNKSDRYEQVVLALVH